MSGIWLVSYIVLWLIVIVSGFIIIALAREIEVLHKRMDSLSSYLTNMQSNSDQVVEQRKENHD